MTSAVLLTTELSLRVAGFGHPTAFFLADEIEGRPMLVNNPRYGWRFFPPTLARDSWPFALPAEKAPGTLRIFVFGESAAMGDPDPRFGLPRMLEALLKLRFADRDFEVVNVAFTAINSHVILPVAREAARHQGDIWILYPGNNEVAGPFGPATVFGSQSPPLPIIRANLTLKSTRFGQLLDSWLARMRDKDATPEKWRGMEMMLGNEIGPADRRLEAVYSAYRKNLEDLIRVGRRAGLPILLCTMGTNLRDCAPFASLHRSDLSSAEQAQWDTAYQTGVNHQQEGNFADALAAFDLALPLDDQHAELHFRLATCLRALDQMERATHHYRQACDADALRFRADSRLNQVVRDVAKTSAHPRLRLFDAEALFVQHSPDRLPGAEFFFEHVHLTPSGNYLLARNLAIHVVDLLQLEISDEPAPRGSPDTTGTTKPGRVDASHNWASEAECHNWLGLTERNLTSIYGRVLSRMRAPPFTQQLTQPAELRRLARQQLALRDALEPPQLRRMAAELRALVDQRPTDGDLRSNYASMLFLIGDLPGAEREWREVTRLLPNASQAWIGLGMSLESQGRRDEAVSCYQRCLDLSPHHPQAHARLTGLSNPQPLR